MALDTPGREPDAADRAPRRRPRGMMRRLVAVSAALAISAGSLGGLYAYGAANPNAGEPMVYPTAEQASNFDFMLSSYKRRVKEGENPLPVFGSSELSPALAGPAHPAKLLSGGAYDVDAMVMGRASTADLWNAIEIGAMSDKVGSKKVVFFVSMQWFMCYRRPQKEFPDIFSQGAFDAFMDNDAISSETKARVLARMADYGVDRESGRTPFEDVVSALDNRANAVTGGLRLAGASLAKEMGWENLIPVKNATDAAERRVATKWKKDTKGSADGKLAKQGEGAKRVNQPKLADGSPDWDTIFADARANAEKRSSGNEYGVYKDFYQKRLKNWFGAAERRWHPKEGEYFSDQELDDFEILLQVCREAGVEPLVVMQPVKGKIFDKTVYTREKRQTFYEKIRGVCADAGVEVADFSGHEYDTYFLRDYSHPSDLGGAYYSRAIYSWYETGHADTSDM